MEVIQNIDLCRKWLILAVTALSLSGLLSIVVVLLRIPSINNLFNNSNIFDAALVIHVNLSVLVWMLSMISLMWCMIMGGKCLHVANITWWISLIGTCLIAASIFASIDGSMKNNYVPILHNVVFLLGLGMFVISIFTNAIFTVIFSNLKNSFEVSVYCSAVFILIAFVCLILANNGIPYGVDMYNFYEYLFWGGGHVLQFAYTQALIVVFIVMLNIDNSKFINISSVINVLLVLPTVFIYFFYPVYDPVLIEFFTLHMKYIGGLFPLIVIIYGIKNIFSKKNNYKNIVLLWSITLFLYGGLLGVSIYQADVTVPAHYHGSIVGVTISLMGLAYILLPKLGFMKLNDRLISIQISLYGLGQGLHISGLAWMGSYGALRKTAGTVLPLSANVARSMFVVGGVMAVFAGFMFVLMMIRSLCKKREYSFNSEI